MTCALALGIAGLAAYLLGRPLLFPSLGPTALLFFEQPLAPAARATPSGATTLIVSLGFLQTPGEMAFLMVGVILLTAAGCTINRAAGVPVPIWSAKSSPEG